MPIHKLTPRKVTSAGPGKHEDGGGLRLVVSKTRARKWMLRFTLHGQRREMGLGYNLMSYLQLTTGRTSVPAPV